MHHFSRWKDSWVAAILALNLLHLFSFFSQGLYNKCAEPSGPNIYPAVDKNASFFFEKVFLKGTSLADHSMQQHKTVLQIAKYFFFWVFKELHLCNSYYTIL